MLAMGLTIAWSVIPARAAGSWWVSAPIGSPKFSAVASDQGSATLAISKGTPGWYSPTSGRFTLLRAPFGPGSRLNPAVAVAAVGRQGVVAYREGQLVEVSEGGTLRLLPSVRGVPRAVAVAGRDPEIVAVATSRGLFTGWLGRPYTRAASGASRAVIAPPTLGRAWLALVNGRLWERPPGRGWAMDSASPNFGLQTSAVAELSSGVILVGQPGGLIWRAYRGRWSRAFQILPYGGLRSVPPVTSLAADSATSAYVGTDGFGTLLTPDGGYSWYRVPPPDSAITSLATLGPVFSAKAHGFVVALASGRVFLHHLQPLPEPPTYTPTAESAELVGTAAVTLAAVLLVVLLLWLLTRRQRRLSV